MDLAKPMILEDMETTEMETTETEEQGEQGSYLGVSGLMWLNGVGAKEPSL